LICIAVTAMLLSEELWPGLGVPAADVGFEADREVEGVLGMLGVLGVLGAGAEVVPRRDSTER
jgi:hypothetical protein